MCGKGAHREDPGREHVYPIGEVNWKGPLQPWELTGRVAARDESGPAPSISTIPSFSPFCCFHSDATRCRAGTEGTHLQGTGLSLSPGFCIGRRWGYIWQDINHHLVIKCLHQMPQRPGPPDPAGKGNLHFYYYTAEHCLGKSSTLLVLV